jgi:GTP-binding protein
LQRTGLLLHLVDIAPIDGSDPAAVVKAIANELVSFSDDLADKQRWLVINKIDLLDENDRRAARDKLTVDLDWQGPVFEVSAATGEGTDALAQAIIRELEAQKGIEDRQA